MTIEAYPEYITGTLTRCHYECFISDEEYSKLKDDKKALEKYIKENGYLDIDDWVIDDIGPIYDIQTY